MKALDNPSDRKRSYVLDPETGKIRIRPRPKLLKRQPARVSRVRALDDLHEKLAIATEFFEHHGDGGRFGTYRAILDILDYFADLGIPNTTLTPLTAVAAAIVDADRGIKSPIFELDRKGRRGAPATPTDRLAFEGILASIMECCVRHCRAEGKRPYVEPASQLAARLIRESSWGVRPTPTQLREIRERVQQNARGSTDRLMFDQLLDSPIAAIIPLEWATSIIGHPLIIVPPK